MQNNVFNILLIEICKVVCSTYNVEGTIKLIEIIRRYPFLNRCRNIPIFHVLAFT